MPTELIIIIALIVVIMGGWAFVEYKWARRPLDTPPATPTAPPPAVVNMPEVAGKARGRAARRMSRGTGPMGRKF